MSRGLLRNSPSNLMAGVIPGAVALRTVPMVIGKLGASIYVIIGLVGSVSLFGCAAWVLSRFFEVLKGLRANTSSATGMTFLSYIRVRTVPASLFITVGKAYLPALLVLALFLPIALLRTGTTPARLPAIAALILAVSTVPALTGRCWVLRDEVRSMVLARLLSERSSKLGC